MTDSQRVSIFSNNGALTARAPGFDPIPLPVNPAEMGALAINANSNGRTTLGICGDSISQNCFNDTAVNSIFFSRGWAAMAPAMAGVYCVPVKYATSGATIQSWAAEHLANVIAAKPSAVTLMLGANNAINPGGYPFAASMTALDEICAALTTAGIYVAHLPTPPQGSIAAPVSAAVSNYIVRLNKHVRDYWVGKAFGEYVDTYSTLVSSTTVSAGTVTTNPWKANYAQADGLNIHPSQLGAYYISYAIFQSGVLQRLFPAYQLIQSNSDYIGTDSTSNQLLPNGLMLGTTGAHDNGFSSGPVATGWRLSGAANVSVVASKATADSGVGEKQILTCTATGAGQVAFYMTGIESNFTSGNTIRAAARIKVTGATAQTRCVWELFASGPGDILGWNDGPQDVSFPTTQQEYLAAITPGRILTYSSGYIRPLLYINFSGAGGAVIEISQAEIRKNY